MRRPPAWAVAVFAAALAVRLFFGLVVDEPLLYSHQYHYFTSGLLLAEHPSPLRYVLLSDEWRLWNGQWTIAPLYHLFLGAMFRLFGAHLAALRLVQSAFDAAAAVAVAALGRRAAGPRGAWAGIAYAAWWPAIEMPSWTMTENLHTVLFVGGIALLAEEAEAPSRRRAFLAGVVLGFSALARSVSSAFLGVAALWRWWVDGRGVAGVRAAAPIVLGGALVILPWTARNVFLVHDAVLIESAAFENIWYANNFADGDRLARQAEVIGAEPTPAGKRHAALLFALRGIARQPRMFVEKIGVNFRHLFRPEGLHNLVRIRRSQEPWRHAASLILDDLVMVILVPLACVFFFGARPTPVRGLVTAWVAYYVFMIVVVFHNEVRYRSALVPFLCVAAVGGVAALGDPSRRRRAGAWVGLAVGVLIVVDMLRPYAIDAVREARAGFETRRALRALSAGDPATALRVTEAAAARAPLSPRPWFDMAKALDLRGDVAGAVAAYRRGEPRAYPTDWRARIGLARLLPVVEPGAAAAKVAELDTISWETDPWLMLEVAWRELPAPAADEVLLARNDYGAVRGFFHPRGLDPNLGAHHQEWAQYGRDGGPLPPPGPHRWTRRHAWVRLRPTFAAPAYEVTIEMGSPFPSPLARAAVTVTGNDGLAHIVVLEPAVQPYMMRIAAPAGEPLVLRIDSPVWSRRGEPADQGVRVDRVSVRPAP